MVRVYRVSGEEQGFEANNGDGPRQGGHEVGVHEQVGHN
jgi:hypothetical protein